MERHPDGSEFHLRRVGKRKMSTPLESLPRRSFFLSLKHFLVLVMVLLLIGCGNLPSSGKCYERDGSELPFVVDFEGVEWKTEKVTYKIFDVDVTACGIPAEATVFPTLARNYPKLQGD